MSEDYKESVRLPKTDFAMKANLKDLEAKVLKSWQDENIYQKIRAKRAGKIKFVLHDGPPYANGHIHLGTSLNKILKDILIKGYTLMGYDAPYVPGWDCHGLPIEWKVEEGFKAAGKSKEEVSKVEFRKECRDFASGWIDIQKEEFKQLGVIGDFENPYLTMDFKSEAIILSEIYKFLVKGNIYLGKKPVMWSVIEKTALAEAEVEYKDKVSDIAYVAFPITNFSKSSFIGAKAVIWTTTPWTLPANRALAYSSEMDYSLIKVTKASENESLENQKLVVAKDLLEDFVKSVKIDDFVELDTSKGLEGLIAEHPLYNLGYSYKVKALEANFVENNVGTGIVHIAPAYGEQDFYLGKKNDLNLEDIINDEGIYKDSVKLFAGNHIFKVNTLVLEKIEECTNLITKAKLKHSYPHSWRSKAPLIYRLTSQIFLNLDKNEIRDKALESIDYKIKFFPESGKNRLHSMVKQRPDWCLSRQRVWGVPIAVFIHKETENILVDEEVNKKIVEAFNEKGADSWFLEDPLNFLPEKYNKNDYKAVMDVIDVWFDSGSTHAFVLKERKELKPVADVYLEGSDQHRGWFQSSLIEGIGSYDEIPYRNLITHGFVLDKNGQKMSKSLGNTIMPLEVIDKYGADILRLWVATSNYKEDVRVSDEILKQQVDYYRKIRNTLKYLLSNLDTIDSKTVDIKYDDLEELEKYILHKLFVLNEEFVETFKNNYDYHILFNSIYNFCSLDLSSFYFDIRKDALYCDAVDSNKVKSAIFTMDIIFDYLIKWLAPFISFTAEEAYRHRYKTKESIFLDNFKVIDEHFYNLSVESKWDQIKLIRKLVTENLEQERANKVIGSSLEAAPVVYLDGYNMDIINTIDFSEVCITSNIILEDIDNLKGDNGIFKDSSLKGVAVKFEKHEGAKCPRCWKKNNDNNEEGLCDRCFGVLGRKK